MNTQNTDMSALATSRFDPAMMDAVNEFQKYAATKNQPMRTMLAEDKPLQEPKVDDEALLSKHVKTDPHMSHLVKTVDANMSTAIDQDVGVPQHQAFAGLAGGVAGMFGNAGKIGFAGFMASTADDLDKILGDDTEVEEPEIGLAVDNSLEPNMKKALAQFKGQQSDKDGLLIEAMHDTTRLNAMGADVSVDEVLSGNLDHATQHIAAANNFAHDKAEAALHEIM